MTVPKSEIEGTEKSAYKSSHWDEPNVLLHTRHNERDIPDPSGNGPLHSLHLEEVQSDWHQAGRKSGYNLGKTNDWKIVKTNNGYKIESEGVPIWEGNTEARANEVLADLRNRNVSMEKGVPDAPFKTTWPDLALKRMLHRAATERNPDGSYKFDALSWTPGEAQAARYDLSKQVEQMESHRRNDGNYHLTIMPKPGSGMPISETKSAAELPNFIGKEMADKIIQHHEAHGGGHHEWNNLDLKVGGHGMHQFYDKMLPDKANALVKRYGTRVQRSNVETNPKGWHITPPDQTVSGKWMVKSNDYNSKGFHFDTEAEARANLEQNIEGERGAKPVHVIPITPALRAAAEKGFPTFRAGGAVRGYQDGWLKETQHG